MHGVRGSAKSLSPRDAAAMRAGRYGAAIAIMREMGWSWADLRAAPFDLVQELTIRLSAENHWQEQRRERDEANRQSRGRG
jgi:hypothetical protein